MASTETGNLIGVGIYSVVEASHLTGVSAGRIRRWLKGYTFWERGKGYTKKPVWAGQLPEIDHKLALGFLDLLEIRFVDAFRAKGVSWNTIRAAGEKARTLFKTTHPFSTQRFRTDGRSIFANLTDASTGEPGLVDIVKTQYAFRALLDQFLQGVEFGQNDQALRWWPLGVKRTVVIDPARSFGQPIASKFGVPTSLIAKAYAMSERSIGAVADWYAIDRPSVRDAVEFEQKIAA